jgi:Domain of unknown function (DUF3883)/Domain of unknown function (DUF3427)
MAITDYPLDRYGFYDRKEAAAALAPDYSFQSQVGSWGISGIVRFGDGPNYVFFVTFGQKQGEHSFDEAVYQNGVVRWQSQPRQKLNHQVIRNLISHNHLTNDILLFLRTSSDTPYTFMGLLKYLNHDAERERPVHFHWEILDFDSSRDYEHLLGLKLQAAPLPTREAASSGLLLQPTLERTGCGTRLSSREFRGAFIDYEERDRRNRNLGRAGELLVLDYQRTQLRDLGRPDLADQVEHVSMTIGDGLGYDIKTFDPETGEEVHLEVKTTTGPAETPFFMSASEVLYARTCKVRYVLLRLYRYGQHDGPVPFFVIDSPLADSERLDLAPVSYRVRLK